MKKGQLRTINGNGHKRTQRKHPTDSELQRLEKDIRNLRDSGKVDSEIRNLLGIEERTYRRYIHKIHEDDKKIWYDIASQELCSELLKLRTCLNNSYNIAKKLSEDENAKIDERLEACQAASDARLSLVQILREYPYFIKTSQTQQQEEQSNTIDVKASTFKRIH